MLSKTNFRKSRNRLEGFTGKLQAPAPQVPGSMCRPCKKCGTTLFRSDLDANIYVCPECGYHFRLSARKRLAMICDIDKFEEWDKDLTSKDVLEFPGYSSKLRNSKLQSREKDGVVTGTAVLGGRQCAFFAMEPGFMMGSMGSVVGEKITRVFEMAAEEKMPVIGFTVSGGARMQEGLYSLMQMAKTSGAVKKHSDAGQLYITVLTDPTTGGVTASFAMLGDIILAEPGALIAFAGPRVIEQTIRQKLPEQFQTAEFLLDKGFVDAVVPRTELKATLEQIISLHPVPAEQQNAEKEDADAGV